MSGIDQSKKPDSLLLLVVWVCIAFFLGGLVIQSKHMNPKQFRIEVGARVYQVQDIRKDEDNKFTVIAKLDTPVIIK